MPEPLKTEYLRAKRAARAGSIVMYALAGFEGIVLAVYLTSLIQVESPLQSLSWWLISILGICSSAAATLLLARFFSQFSRGKTPFGRRQFNRLLFAAMCLVIRGIADCRPSSALYQSTLPDGSSISLAPAATLDLKVVVMVVFLVCLAMVVRYGDALKEDSDAFV
ncbi:hypothetical protein [Olsenella sp. SW781]|uniref:hypothetical protein n=1 Tax=Olsenella sp. SW781 TaxID=2530046 RepID=UPI00143CBD19|nr:hypothetical protein [Olsenella sp. SW781]